MKSIQEWLRHSDYATTANIYGHLDINDKLESASVMNDVFKTMEKCERELEENLTENEGVNI